MIRERQRRFIKIDSSLERQIFSNFITRSKGIKLIMVCKNNRDKMMIIEMIC